MQNIKIGDRYKDRKTGRVMEVTEKYTVYNSKNEIVRVFYSAKGSTSLLLPAMFAGSQFGKIK